MNLSKIIKLWTDILNILPPTVYNWLIIGNTKISILFSFINKQKENTDTKNKARI